MSSVSPSTQTEQSPQIPPDHVFGSHAIQGDPPVRDSKKVTLAFERRTFPALVKRLDPEQEGEYDPTVVTQVRARSTTTVEYIHSSIEII